MALDRNLVATKEPFYCRTLAFRPMFSVNDGDDLDIVTYLEAWQSDPFRGLWTIQEVQILMDKDTTSTFTMGEHKNISFAEMLQQMAYFETSRLSEIYNPEAESAQPGDIVEPMSDEQRAALNLDEVDVGEYTFDKDRKLSDLKKALGFEIVGDTPETLGEIHFIHYAESNGIVFDKHSQPHTRPHRLAIPQGADFRFSDIDRANKRWKETGMVQQRSVAFQISPQSLPSMFESAANINTEAVINRDGKRRIDLFDEFCKHLERAKQKQEEYVKTFDRLGRAPLLYDGDSGAMTHLENAEKLIKKRFESEGIPNAQDYLSFITEQKLFVLLLHVEALQTLNNREVYDQHASESKERQLDLNSKAIKQKLNEAEKIYRSLDGITSKDVENMRKTALTTEPTVNSRLTDLLKDYAAKRTLFIESAEQSKYLGVDRVLPNAVHSMKKRNAEAAAEAAKKKKRGFFG